MELRCPSCGSHHQSEDYPGAFEIQCSCGYSILLPDEDPEENNKQEPNFNDIPAAMEVEDDELRDSLEKGLLNNENNSLNIASGSDDNGLTPPEELPSEMAYDPFEVEQLEPPNEELSTDEELSEEAPSGDEDFYDDQDEFGSEEASIESSPEDPLASEHPEEDSTETPTAEENSSEDDPCQQIITRTQLASMGQLIGPSYNLHWTELERLQLVEIKEKLQEELLKWPWLEDELKSREINIQEIEKLESLENVPELVAVQLYILCFEHGGKCSFTLTKI